MKREKIKLQTVVECGMLINLEKTIFESKQSIENFDLELSRIKQIAQINGFQEETIVSKLNNKHHKIALNLIYPPINNIENNYYRTLSCIVNATHKISTFLKRLDIPLAFSTNNSLGKFINNSKSKISKGNKSAEST